MDKAEAAEIFSPAAWEAVRAFPVEVETLELVSLSENIAYRVWDPSGESYVLRLHRPGYHTLEELKSERMWTRALVEAGVAAPTPLSTRNGDDYVSVPVAALSQERHAGMLRWASGDVLADVLSAEDLPELERRFEQIGALEASMHDQASAWDIPPAFRRHSVDAEGLMGEQPFWGPFWDHPVFSPAERRLVIETRDRIRRVLQRLGRDRRVFGLIHADLHSGNIVVDGDRLAVIDFDDAGFGWLVYDVAVTLVGWQSSRHFDSIQRAFVRGYRSRRELGDEALALIPMFLLVRSLAQLGWLHQRPEIDASRQIHALKDTACAKCAAFVEPL